MRSIFYNIFVIIFAYIAYIASRNQLHMAQLEGYKPSQYQNWIKHNYNTLFLKSFFKNLKADNKAKKPLAFTHRAIRLFAIDLIILVKLFVILYFVPIGDFVVLFINIVMILLIPMFMLLATAIAFPIEMAIQRKYYNEAKDKIKSMKNLKVIGITGSYGKTSTKYFVKTILSEKYNTIMTPESYNTPMGITKVIRESLNEEHEVFVCEMGARNVGDIKELVELANPSIGILTSIGPQHLETFKSIENVARTKYELIEGLPEDGIGIFNADNKFCLDFSKITKQKKYLYGITNKDQDIFVYAEEIKNSRQGLKFTIKGQNGIKFECQTALLGKHNISNILAAVCVALHLNLSIDQIISGISKIKPVPHRLELIPTSNGVTVIDDAFNSNPTGAKEALEAIKDFSDGRKIIITPGMVELGTIEYEENKKLGKTIAECCDYAILVGQKRSKAILEGLKECNFQEENIRIAANLDEATAMLGQIVRAGDVVLFENDLPDNYNEA